MMTSTVTLFNLNDSTKFRQHLNDLEPICQMLEPDDEAPPPPIPNLEALEIAEEKTCVTCNLVFETRLEQVEHFRGDWHRLNMKARLKGGSTISQDEFEQLGSDCESISASESESDDDSVTNIEIVFDAAKLLFMNSEGSVVEISRTLLKARNESITSTELLNRVGALKDLWMGLIVISGGHFAAAIYRNGKIVHHKTFHQYTVRRKQGGSQSKFDSKGGAAKSAGASLRRYNEKTLMEKSHTILKSWQSEFNNCSVVLFRALGVNNRSILFGGADPIFQKDDIRLRTIPMVTRRPTLKELDRIHSVVTTVKVVRDPSNYYETKNVTINKDRQIRNKSKHDTLKDGGSRSVTEDDLDLVETKPKRNRPKKLPPAKEVIEDVFTACRDDDIELIDSIASKVDSECLSQAFICPLDEQANTVIHFCCRRGRDAILEKLLALGADPTVTNGTGQTPYTVAANDKIRRKLISFRQENPTLWNYELAKIPDKLPEPTKKKKQEITKSEKLAKQQQKNKNLLERLTETMRSCDMCQKEFRTVPLEADGKRFCSVNCVRAWRFS